MNARKSRGTGRESYGNSRNDGTLTAREKSVLASILEWEKDREADGDDDTGRKKKRRRAAEKTSAA